MLLLLVFATAYNPKSAGQMGDYDELPNKAKLEN
jgi:hypothetical protein